MLPFSTSKSAGKGKPATTELSHPTPPPPSPPASKGSGLWDTVKTGATNLISDLQKGLVDLFKSIGKPVADAGADWYKVFPYQLVIVKYKDDPVFDPTRRQNSNDPRVLDKPTHKIDKSFYYTLPIPPESLTINMVSASEATPTLGGVVEETSAVVFWDIQVSGTTGMAIGYQDKSNCSEMADSFRSSLSTTGLLVGAFSDAAKAAGGIGTMIDAAKDAQESFKSASGLMASTTSLFGGLSNIMGSAFLPKLPYYSSAVNRKSNGYTTIKDLEAVFHTYSSNKELFPGRYDLFFVNQKDDSVYRVILKGGVQIQKSARDPYLYRYSFALKGWNKKDLKHSAFGASKREVNRYKTDLASVNTLNSPQITNAMSKIQTKAVDLGRLFK